jgi:hypothetical protein
LVLLMSRSAPGSHVRARISIDSSRWYTSNKLHTLLSRSAVQILGKPRGGAGSVSKQRLRQDDGQGRLQDALE